MNLDMAPPRRRVDWVKLQHSLKIAGILAGVFAAGGWLVSIRTQEARLPYLERATHKQEALERVAGPNPLAALKCERKARQVAEDVAGTAVALSTVSAVPQQVLDKIPDCPKPKAPPAGPLVR